MKIRTKLTIFFTAIFLVVVTVLSIWYQYKLFDILRQGSTKNLEMYIRSFFDLKRMPPNKDDLFQAKKDIPVPDKLKPQPMIGFEDFLSLLNDREKRDGFSEVISKRSWYGLYDKELKPVYETQFTKVFPLKNISMILKKNNFTVKLKTSLDYFKKNNIEAMPDYGFIMEQEFYTEKDNYEFNCIGKTSVIKDNNGNNYYFIVLFPDDKNVQYLEKSIINVVFTLIVVFCLIILIGLIYSKYSLNPINRIIHELNNINEHDLSKRIKFNTKNKDEISEISFSINNLLNRIESAFNMEKQFISDVSHEFKTPISILQLNIDNLANNPNLTDSEIDKISSSLEILYSLNFLIQKLLYLSRLESNLSEFKTETFSMSDLILSVYNNLKNIAEIKILDFKLEIVNDFSIIGDKELLYIAFYNIVENALKYTEKGSVIIKISNNQITIDDSGIGIHKDHVGKIFNKFYRADLSRNDNKSYGIGLTIAKRIFDISNANINIVSKLNEGTKFIVSFLQ